MRSTNQNASVFYIIFQLHRRLKVYRSLGQNHRIDRYSPKTEEFNTRLERSGYSMKIHANMSISRIRKGQVKLWTAYSKVPRNASARLDSFRYLPASHRRYAAPSRRLAISRVTPVRGWKLLVRIDGLCNTQTCVIHYTKVCVIYTLCIAQCIVHCAIHCV